MQKKTIFQFSLAKTISNSRESVNLHTFENETIINENGRM